MLPAAAVTGLYFAHPAAQYFSVGRVGRDQVEDYAARKGWELAEVERWLGPNLAYTPDTLARAHRPRRGVTRSLNEARMRLRLNGSEFP